MAQKFYVEWGGSKTFEFRTMIKNLTTGQYEEVEPEVVYAQVETVELEPKKIKDAYVQQIDRGRFLASFEADPDTIESGKAYYLAFYWSYRTNITVERVMIVVVPDVPSEMITD